MYLGALKKNVYSAAFDCNVLYIFIKFEMSLVGSI